MPTLQENVHVNLIRQQYKVWHFPKSTIDFSLSFNNIHDASGILQWVRN